MSAPHSSAMTNPATHPLADTAEKRALCFELPAGNGVGGAAPDWIMLLPPGPDVAGVDGRRWRLSDPSRLIDAFKARGRDVVVDWEHGSEGKALAGERTPAAGWIKELQVRDGAVWGRVAWTDQGRADVTSGAYRHISPAFDYSRTTYEIHRLASVGLVHAPNLPELPALNRENPNREKLMDLSMLAAELGLPGAATLGDVLAAVRKAKADLVTATNRAETPDISRFVPRADFDAAVVRAANAEQKLAEQTEAGLKAEADALIAKALGDRVIAPVEEAHFRAQCRDRAGLDNVRAYFAVKPKVLDAASEADLPPPAAGGPLNDDERAVCRQMGIGEADFVKFRDSQKEGK